MRRVRRHLFVPPELAAMAYHDTPLPIGFDKTVSQPFICALMADLLDPQPHEAVLEVGTGLGYQAAVLAELARQVGIGKRGPLTSA
jgi:protein-L-isoaspartate(D-aspartate) O-methyltransferase